MLEISTNSRSVAVRYEAASKVVASNVFKAMRDVGAELVRAVKTEQLSGQALNVRTGNLRRAAIFRVLTEPQSVTTVVNFDGGRAKYAGIQEHGGIVVAKGQKLTIPLSAVRTAAGVPRFTARELFQSPGAYGFKGVFVAKNIIFGKKGQRRSARIVPLFKLQRSIELKAREPLKKALASRMEWIRTRLGLATATAAKEAGL